MTCLEIRMGMGHGFRGSLVHSKHLTVLWESASSSPYWAWGWGRAVPSGCAWEGGGPPLQAIPAPGWRERRVALG